MCSLALAIIRGEINLFRPHGTVGPRNLEGVVQAILIVRRTEGCTKVFRPGYVARIDDARRGESRCIGSLQWKEYALRWSAANPAAAILNPDARALYKTITRRELMTALPATSNASSLSSISPRGFVARIYVGVNARACTCTRFHPSEQGWVCKREISPIHGRYDADVRVAES